jgi:hypothetical protein
MAEPEQIRAAILKKGYIDVKVYVAGLRQGHRLTIVMENTVHGKVPYLMCKNYIPSSELVRLANELMLPIKHNNTMVLPKGMMPKDFAHISVEPDTVEAEVE